MFSVFGDNDGEYEGFLGGCKYYAQVASAWTEDTFSEAAHIGSLTSCVLAVGSGIAYLTRGADAAKEMVLQAGMTLGGSIVAKAVSWSGGYSFYLLD